MGSNQGMLFMVREGGGGGGGMARGLCDSLCAYSGTPKCGPLVYPATHLRSWT